VAPTHRDIGDSEIDALVTTGAHTDAGKLGRLPDNVRVERYVPPKTRC
jgi:hypothetical protein